VINGLEEKGPMMIPRACWSGTGRDFCGIRLEIAAAPGLLKPTVNGSQKGDQGIAVDV